MSEKSDLGTTDLTVRSLRVLKDFNSPTTSHLETKTIQNESDSVLIRATINTLGQNLAISSVVISCSDPVVYQKSDGSYDPEEITFYAKNPGDTVYLGHWKLYRGDYLEYTSTTDESSATITTDILPGEIIPDDDLVVGSRSFTAELYAPGGLVKIAELSVGTMADTKGITEVNVPVYSPHYLGRYHYSERPLVGLNIDDTCTLYSETSGERGIYKATSATVLEKQTTPTTEMIAAAWADICWIENQTPYGAVTDYTGSGLNFIEVLGANIAFINKLFANEVTLASAGWLKSHDYAETGGYPTAGFMLDVANQVIKAYGGVFNHVLVGGTLQLSGYTAGDNYMGSVSLMTGLQSTKIETEYVVYYYGFQVSFSGTVRIFLFLDTNNPPVSGNHLYYKIGHTPDDGSGYHEYTEVDVSSYPEGGGVYSDISVVEGDILIVYARKQNSSTTIGIMGGKLGVAEVPGLARFSVVAYKASTEPAPR
jgi:hypothetical protein